MMYYAPSRNIRGALTDEVYSFFVCISCSHLCGSFCLEWYEHSFKDYQFVVKYKKLSYKLCGLIIYLARNFMQVYEA